eukprot:3938408-Amphidinium_carterae.1
MTTWDGLPLMPKLWNANSGWDAIFAKPKLWNGNSGWDAIDPKMGGPCYNGFTGFVFTIKFNM